MTIREPALSELATRAAADLQRPQYHFRPPPSIIGDPNGLTFRDGVYHVFFQYVPPGGGQLWGHASTTDLVHWTNLPIALVPAAGTYDELGCWSGSAADDDGTPVILYTGIDRFRAPRDWGQNICLATGTPDLLKWQKYPGNPVVKAPPPDLNVAGFRDPCFWKKNGTWYMLVGSGIRNRGGTALLYRSADLREWDYLHPFCPSPDSGCHMWECPDFFPLGDRHVLIVSKTSPHLWYSSVEPARSMLSTFAFIGSYENDRFTPEKEINLDVGGGHFYAAQTLLDGRERRLMWGTLHEARPGEAAEAAGWKNVLSLPRVLSLRSNGDLEMHPPPELEALRGAHWHADTLELNNSEHIPAADAEGTCLEIIAEFDPGDAEELGLIIRRSPNAEEETRLVYYPSRGLLLLDRSRSSLDRAVESSIRGGDLQLRDKEPLRLQVFLDRSTIEVFANRRRCLTSRIYPTRPDSRGLRVFATGGRGSVLSFDAWQLSVSK